MMSFKFILWELSQKRGQLLLCPPPDAEVPQDFRKTSWNSSSVSMAWTYPTGNHTHFLLTAFYLNGSDHVINNESIWHKGANLELTLANLPACSRVKFGLQAVCQDGMESHYSSMVKHDGNSRKASMSCLSVCLLGGRCFSNIRGKFRRVTLRQLVWFCHLEEKPAQPLSHSCHTTV